MAFFKLQPRKSAPLKFAFMNFTRDRSDFWKSIPINVAFLKLELFKLESNILDLFKSESQKYAEFNADFWMLRLKILQSSNLRP